MRFTPCGPRELQLDLDRQSDFDHFWTCLPWFARIAKAHGWPVRAVSMTRSRSGKHWHVTIELPRRVPHIERVMWQAILGSDRAREFCNAARVLRRAPYPIVLFSSGKQPGHMARDLQSKDRGE